MTVSICVCPTEGSVRTEELLGGVSPTLVQRGLSAGLFRVPPVSSRQVQYGLKHPRRINAVHFRLSFDKTAFPIATAPQLE